MRQDNETVEKRVESVVAPWNNPSIRWVCEEHPTKDQGHLIEHLKFGRVRIATECGGAGMPDPMTHDSFGKQLSVVLVEHCGWHPVETWQRCRDCVTRSTTDSSEPQKVTGESSNPL